MLAALLMSATRSVWTLDPDAAAYVSLARSLAAGDGYTLGDGIPHAKYPPGSPAFMAAMMALAGPEAYRVLHLGAVAALLLALIVVARLMAALGYGERVVLVVAACTGLSQPLFELSVVYLRSEPLYLLLTMTALLGMLRALAPDGSTRWMFLGGLAAMAAISVRMAGVALIAVPLLRLVAPGSGTSGGALRLRAAVLAVCCLAPVVAWQVRAAGIQAAHPDAPDYGAELFAAEPRDLTKTVRLDMPGLDAAAFVHRVAGNLDVLARATATLETNVDRAAHRLPVGVLLLSVTLLGLGCLLAQGGHRRDIAAYALATLALFCAWPFNQQERFYAPLLPILLLAAGEGLAALSRLAARTTASPRGRTALVITGAVVLLTLAAQTSDHPRLLNRWSYSYAALLVVVASAWAVVAVRLRRRPWPALDSRAFLVVVVLFVVPWLHLRFVTWPAKQADFRNRRAEQTVPERLARIDVHPVLEDIARFLDDTPPDTVMMIDVPKIMTLLSGRTCIPITYRVDPPELIVGAADYLYYTGEIPAVADVFAAGTGEYPAVADITDGDGTVVGQIRRVH